MQSDLALFLTAHLDIWNPILNKGINLPINKIIMMEQGY